MHRVKINNKKYLSRMGTILNFSKWERMYEQAEAEENNIESFKKGDLNFIEDSDKSVDIATYLTANGQSSVKLEFDGDKISVSSIEAKGGASEKRQGNLTPSGALINFFSLAGLLKEDRINLVPMAKKLATLILDKTDAQDSPPSLKGMFAKLINSEGNVIEGTMDWVKPANEAMATAVKEYNELNKNN